MDQLQPAQAVWGLVTSHALARCIHVVADAGVADALADTPASAAELAQSSGLNAGALHRMLRLLSEVIHDWADSEAERILAAVRRAAPPQARLLIVEALVADAPGPHFGKVLDVIMLAVTGGRERTRSEYEALLGSAGFRLEQVVPTSSQYSIVEAVTV